MVMKRKLPSAMAKEAGKENNPSSDPTQSMKASSSGASLPWDDAAPSAPSAPSAPADPTQQPRRASVAPNPYKQESSAPMAPPVSTPAEESIIPKQEKEVDFNDLPKTEETTQAGVSGFEMPSFNDFASTAGQDNAAMAWATEPEMAAPASSSPMGQSMASEVPDRPARPSGPDSDWQLDDLLADAPNDESLFVDTDMATQKQEPSSPYQQSGAQPAELPGGAVGTKPHGPSTTSSSTAKVPENGLMVGAGAIVLLVVAGVLGYKVFVQNDEVVERVNRWSGSMKEVSEALPESVEQGTVQKGRAQAILQPEAIVTSEGQSTASDDSLHVNDEPAVITLEEAHAQDPVSEDLFEADIPADESQVSDAPVGATEDADKGTIIEFVDVAEDEVDQPIDGVDADVPDDVGVIVQLQRAIDKARQEKNPEDFKQAESQLKEVVTAEESIAEGEAKTAEQLAAEEASKELTADEKKVRNKALAAQLEEDLAAYRRALAGEPGRSPNIVDPGTYFKSREDGAETAMLEKPEPVKVPAKRESSILSQEDAKNVYGANPKGLPYVPQPGATSAPMVRTLQDYDVTMFEPQRPKVRIPDHIKPSFNQSAFPDVTLLSLVAGRGIIAETPGARGVLMIGETLEGWELIEVTNGYATFHKNNIKHTVTLGQ